MGDTISDALSAIMIAENINKKECLVKRSSKLLLNVLGIIKANGYINDFRVVSRLRGSVLVSLSGKINKIGSIRPRFPCKVTEYESYEKMFLPASGFGFIIVSTSEGLMTHADAKNKNLGGTLIAYFY